MNLIFCPHTDDAIFSLGSYLLQNSNFTIATAFAGIPTDKNGFDKHTKLRIEHSIACNYINANEINNNLLDDVYGTQDLYLLNSWINTTIKGFENVYIPIGIHHPDHILLADCMMNMTNAFNAKNIYIYAELPYRIRYKKLYEERLRKINNQYHIEKINIIQHNEKKKLVSLYQSQIDDKLINDVLVEESLWKVSR